MSSATLYFVAVRITQLELIYSPPSIIEMDVGDLLVVVAFFFLPPLMGLKVSFLLLLLLIKSTLSNDVKLSNEQQLVREKLSKALHLLW